MSHDLLPPLQHMDVHRETTIEDSYREFLKCSYSLQDVKAVERLTRGQASNPMWHQFRKGAITASKAKDICMIVNGTLTDDYTAINKLLNSLLDPPHFETASTKWGLSQEKIALDWYGLKQSSKHTGFSCRQTGLYMSTENLLVGASPDGLCYCKCCRHPFRKWLVEVKSPYNNRFMEPSEAAWETGAFTREHDGTLTLKSDHKWNYQVQLQMGVVGVRLCHLVISTTLGNHIVPVYFDETYSAMMLHFEKFIDVFLFPKLYTPDMVARYGPMEIKVEGKLQLVRLFVNLTQMVHDMRISMA